MQYFILRIRLSLTLVFFFASFSFIQAQLQQVDAKDGYLYHQSILLNDAILVSNDAEFSSREYFLTSDFKNFRRAVARNLYLGKFNLKNDSYLVIRNPIQGEMCSIVRVNNDLSLDTVAQFSVENGTFKLLAQKGHYAYFSVGTSFFRFNESSQNIEQINVGVLGGLDFRFYDVFLHNDAFFIVEDHIYRLGNSDSTFTKGLKTNDPRYPNLVLHPKIKADGGIKVVFRDPVDGRDYSGILQGNSTITQISALPDWPDPKFQGSPFAGNNLMRVSTSAIGSNNQHFILVRRGRLKDIGEYEIRTGWYYFDTLATNPKLITDTTRLSAIDHYHATFKLNNGTLAFAMHENKGLELLKLHADSVELLRDNFKGMASGISSYNQAEILNGKLYYMATHPHYGYSLHRTDGSRQGTGVLASLQWDFQRSKLISFDGKVYLIGNTLGLNDKVFVVPNDSPFLTDKYSLNSSSHWNQSIYSNLYYWSVSGRSRYNRPMMKNQPGLVLSITSSHTSGKRFFPEDELSSRFHPRTNNLWNLVKTYALYDTSGNILLTGSLSGYRGNSLLALAPDTTLLTYFKHKDFSYTNFDSIHLPGEHNFFKAYDLHGTVKWSQRLSPNFKIMDMLADDAGNFIVAGEYQGGALNFLGESLYSPYNYQYFVAKISSRGELIWIANSPMQGFKHPTELMHLHLDDPSEKVYLLISEGSPNVASSCRFSSWLAKLSKIDALTGKAYWTQNIETTDLSAFYGLSTTPLNEVWIAGWFRGEYLDNGKIQEKAEGAECPKNGLLICLDQSTGEYKKSSSNPQGSYGTITATDNSIYTLWYSYERIINQSEFSGYRATNIEQRDLSGIVKANYQFPSSKAEAKNFFQLKVLENKKQDWLMFSGASDGSLISDSLYQAGVSLDGKHHSTFLMRRSGQIFRDLEVKEPMRQQADNPFSIYPNPASFHTVFVRASANEKPFTQYQLSGLDGRVVASGALNEVGFPQHLTFPQNLQGLYILNLSGNNQPQSFKLLLE